MSQKPRHSGQEFRQQRAAPRTVSQFPAKTSPMLAPAHASPCRQSPTKHRPTSRQRRCCLRHPCTSLVPFSMQLAVPVRHHFPFSRGALCWSTFMVQTSSHSRPGHGDGRPWEAQSERWHHEASARAYVGVRCTSPPPCHSASGFWWSLGIAQHTSYCA